MEPGPSSLRSSVSGKSSIRMGLMSSELARALKERLQVTSGDDTLTVLPEGSIENTVLSCFTGLAFMASSMTWVILSLSMTLSAAGSEGCSGCCSDLFLRRLRARSPSEGASSCATAASGSVAKSMSTGAMNRKIGTLRRMIFGGCARARVHGGAQTVHRQSLGEMEQKRSYRKDTLVLALPELAQEGWEWGMDALRSKRRATGRVHAPFTSGYSRPDLRKRVIGSVTCIG